MIPDYLLDQPLHILQARGYSFKDISEDQKKTAIWWDNFYKECENLPLQEFSEARYKKQGYKKVMRDFVTGKYPVWEKAAYS